MPARTRIRYGPREQRERERGDELEHFYHKSQQLGSTHSIFSKTLGGAVECFRHDKASIVRRMAPLASPSAARGNSTACLRPALSNADPRRNVVSGSTRA